jgi:hypothetical protein
LLDGFEHFLANLDAADFVQLTRRSVKQRMDAWKNNLPMNAVACETVTVEHELAAALAKWYATHSAIRRLWAIEDAVALTILITLEPTADGDDTLPVWLARRADWESDLHLLVGREVQLQLLASDAFVESYLNPDAVTIAEVSWRDSWIIS